MNVGVITNTFVALQVFAQLATTTKLVCYFTYRSRFRPSVAKFLPQNVNPHLCTHLVYDFAIVNEENEIDKSEWNESPYSSFIELKNSNPKLKMLLSVKERNDGSQFNTMVSSALTRQTFIQSVINFLRKYGFDGLDLAWMFLGASGGPVMNKYRFSLLCEELFRAFKLESNGGRKPRLLLSAAVPADPDVVDAGYEITEVSKYLDWISVKTFDLRADENRTSHHSPLYSNDSANIDSAIQHWLDRGAPPGKLLLGFPTYSRSFTLSTSDTSLGAPTSMLGIPGTYTSEMGVWAYFETCKFLRAASKLQWIAEQDVPYAAQVTQWVGFDNQHSYSAKVEYLKSWSLGGAAVWTLDMDDFSGECGQGSYPLISHLNQELFDGWTPPVTTPSTTTVNEDTEDTVPGTVQHSCLQNTTTLYPHTRFCESREDGLYLRTLDPKTFYKCLQGASFIIKCNTGSGHNDGERMVPSKTLISVGLAIASGVYLLCSWSDR